MYKHQQVCVYTDEQVCTRSVRKHTHTHTHTQHTHTHTYTHTHTHTHTHTPLSSDRLVANFGYMDYDRYKTTNFGMTEWSRNLEGLEVD